MRKGETLELFGHEMEVVERKESLVNKDGKMVDLLRYDLICTCHSYPNNLVIEATEETLELMSVLNGFNESDE
jgi:hypothetical protein